MGTSCKSSPSPRLGDTSETAGGPLGGGQPPLQLGEGEQLDSGRTPLSAISFALRTYIRDRIRYHVQRAGHAKKALNHVAHTDLGVNAIYDHVSVLLKQAAQNWLGGAVPGEDVEKLLLKNQFTAMRDRGRDFRLRQIPIAD